MIEVTAAIIFNETGEVLLAQRSQVTELPLKWEFPGGKLEDGESLEDCIQREIQEELGVTLKNVNFYMSCDYDYSFLQLRLHAFRAEVDQGAPKPKEHQAIKWVRLDELASFDLAPADVAIAKQLASKPTK